MEQHPPIPDCGKVVLHLEGLDLSILLENLAETRAKPRDVPLPAADLEEATSIGSVRGDPERVLERLVHRLGPQIAVEHEQAFTERLDDRIGVLARRFDLHLVTLGG